MFLVHVNLNAVTTLAYCCARGAQDRKIMPEGNVIVPQGHAFSIMIEQKATQHLRSVGFFEILIYVPVGFFEKLLI